MTTRNLSTWDDEQRSGRLYTPLQSAHVKTYEAATDPYQSLGGFIGSTRKKLEQVTPSTHPYFYTRFIGKQIDCDPPPQWIMTRLLMASGYSRRVDDPAWNMLKDYVTAPYVYEFELGLWSRPYNHRILNLDKDGHISNYIRNEYKQARMNIILLDNIIAAIAWF